MATKVKDIMHSPVATCVIDSDVGGVRDFLHQKGINAVPIVDASSSVVTIQGIVTTNDLVGVFDDTISIKQVMSQTIIIVEPEQSISEAAKMMMDNNIHHLVVFEEGHLVGMVSSLDFVRWVAESGASNN